MTIQTVGRAGAMLFLAALISGCSWGRHQPSSGQRAISNECRTQASCNYNGQYEPGERDYAEQEAKRLNQQQTQRLRGSSWW
ncbi:Lipoprotein OS=Castellaniella defragrans OX=75697 GN=HNR28_000812 PE=4 SV=1 [Castellaniella defragrans]